MKCYRLTIFICFMFILSCFSLTYAEDQEPLLRKNIDNLTPEELAAYEHAIQLLKDRSNINPYDESGFLWQSWIHNCPSVWVKMDDTPLENEDYECDFWKGRRTSPAPNYQRSFPGFCEHGKDLFLVWHRAELYYFEKLLQGTDPDGILSDSRDPAQVGPSTKHVTVPYWNWTRPPSGNRFPKVFEKGDSPLFHNGRNTTVVAPEDYHYTSPYLIAYQIYFLGWPQFAGYVRGQYGGYGDFEVEAHNNMHSDYIGGDMAESSTAALDPIFYSFHAYIDLIYERWIEEHGIDSITSQNTHLRGTQPSSVTDPEGFPDSVDAASMGPPLLYFDTRILGYTYEIKEEDAFVPKDKLLNFLRGDNSAIPVHGTTPVSRFRRLIMQGGARPNINPAINHVIDILIRPPSSGENHILFIGREDAETDHSFSVDIYLHPGTVAFNVNNRQHQDQYLISRRFHWGTGSTPHHEDTVMSMALNVNQILSVLAEEGHTDKTWHISVAISGLPQVGKFKMSRVEVR